MPWNEIKLNISANMDFGDAKQQISTIKQGIDGLKTSISEMPNVSKILDNSFERSATVVDALNDKLDRLEHRKYSSDEERLSLERGANNNILELNALRDVQLGTTSYSAQVAKRWFGDLPSAIQHQFDTIAPQLTAIIRSRMSSLSKAGEAPLTKMSGQIARELTGGANPTRMDASIRNLLNKHGLSGTDAEFKYLDQMIEYLIPSVMPANMNKYYQKARYGQTRQSASAGIYSGKPEDLFPESFKETFRSQGKAFQTFDKAYQSMVLDSSYRKQLDNILKSNPVAVRAALASGISRRDERGVLETKDEITRSEWEGFRRALYDDLLVRVSGYKGNEIDAYKATGKDKRTLMQRLTSSTSGRAMLAMQDIEGMEDTRAWTNAANPGTWSKLQDRSGRPLEGKRIEDQLVVSKYSPFTGDKVALGDPRSIMISESHNTRLLGGGKWKNNQDVSDTIRLVSLAGYDAKNPEHQRFLENLFNPNGAQLGNAKFVAQSIHGTGQDTIVRMIEQEAFNRVNEQEAQWIKNHPDEAVRGIRGTYWRGFDDAEIDRLIQNGIGGKDGITAQKYGKHLEMLNKAWTNTSDLGLNIDGKRFAVVDTSRLKDQLGGVSPGDGGAFFASSVMPHSGQFRGGIGLKGSAFVFEGNDLKAFGKKTGLLDEQGRLMMPGPNGELFDISGYQGFIPLDVVKNQGVLKDENGNYVSGDIASRRFTALLQRYPMSYHADYDLDQVASDNLGTQMSSFMMFSPELRQHQIDMAMRRMQELDTEEGQLKYVFGNKDDYLSRKVNPLFGGNSQLLASTEARSRIDNMRASLYNDLIAGKYINFENDDKIANLRAAASPLATLLLSKDGTIPDATITKARSFLDKDANARLSDQDIRDMIILPKDKVIDFNRKDEPNVAVVRSPTGYGNMYYATNLAKDAEPIYRGFGISTSTGMYVSERDREKLQGMDFDADQVKAIYDRQLAEAVQSSLKQMGTYKPSDVKAEDIVYTPEQLKSWSVQNRLQAERSVYATMPMGTGSSGIRIMQVDYSRPENQALVYAAQRMAGIYDIGSTPKKAQTYSLEKDDPVWAALGLGKEYTKFSERRTDLFKFDEGMIVSPSHKNAVKTREGTYIDASHPDVYKASNGEYVNLRALRDMGVDEINLPSRYMANHMMAISTANRLYRTGNVDPTQMDAIYEAMNEKLGYGDAGPERTKLMQTMRMLQHQFGTGERAYITNDEGQYIQGLINSAAAELTLSAADHLDPTTGKYILGDKQYDTKEQWAKAQEARYGIRTARNAIDRFGMLESDLVSTYGEEFRTNFINVTDAAGQTFVSKIHELRKQAEQYKEPEQPKDPEKPATTVVANGNIIKDEKGNFIYEDKHTGNLVYVENPKASGSASMPIQGVVSTNQSESADAIWGPQTSKRAEQAEQRDKVLADLKNYEHALDISNQVEQTRIAAQAFNNELLKEQLGKANKINNTKTLAERQYNYLQYQMNDQLDPVNALIDKIQTDPAFKGDKELETQSSGWIAQLKEAKDNITTNMEKSFTNGVILDAKRLEDDLTKEVNGFGLSKQKDTLNKYDERISQQQQSVAWMQGRLDKGLVRPGFEKQYEDAIKDANQRIANAQVARANLAAEYTTQNETAGRLALESLQIKQGLKSKNSLSVISAARKQEISALRKQVGNQYNEGQYSQEEYDRITAGLDQLESRANPAMIALGQGAKILKTELKSTAGYLTNMFTRRLFQSAISETTNFVKQFDASMNTIQMITLKTDEQISTLGDTLIDKAKEMKVSVSEITQSAATLYRQGLSDQEVDERLGVISKFSKVSGTKVDAATKLITVAMNTGLVQNAETAADIVTALGDNAATNAAEIEKGIEKAGAAAAADGTTFAQLSAMLTAITSTTQIGGNVAGRTLNTIFGRMNKIGTNELIYDENGNAVSGSAVAKLLEEEGIRMYDEYGNKRSSFDTLYALSQKWEGLSDAKQQQFANAIAGTRQYSNFAAIMSGMAEGKVEEYLQLAGESEGITDRKYEIYTKSLNASLTDLKNTWDGLVNDMTDSGTLTGGLGFLTNFIQGIDKANEAAGGLGATITGLLPSLMVLGGLKSGTPAGLGLAAGGLGLAAIVSAIGEQKSYSEQYQEFLESANSDIEKRNSSIEKAKTLRDKGDQRTEAENNEYDRLLRTLSVSIDYGNINNATEAEQTQNRRIVADQIIEQAEKGSKVNRVKRIALGSYLQSKAAIDEVAHDLAEYDKEVTSFDSTLMQNYLKRDETGKYSSEYLFSSLANGLNNSTAQKQMSLALANAIAEGYISPENAPISADQFINALAGRITAYRGEGQSGREAILKSDEVVLQGMLDYLSNTEDQKPKLYNELIQKQFIDSMSEYDQDLTDDELYLMSEHAAELYKEYYAQNRENNQDINNAAYNAYNRVLSEIFGLNEKEKTDETITSYENAFKKAAGVVDRKALKFNALDYEYVNGGFYYDNRAKQYLTPDQAEKQIDVYNDRIAAFEKAYNDIEAEYHEVDGLSEEDQKKAINKLNNKLYSAGIKFTGDFFDFMNNTTDDLVNFIEGLESPEQNIKPDFTAYKDHFRAQAQSTYNTWESKNQLPIIATRMYEMILDNGLNDLQSLYDYVVKEDIGNWEILNQSEDFAKLALRIQRDETTGKILNGDELYQQYIDALLSTSGEYNQRNLSNVEKGAKLSKAIEKLEEGYYLSYDLQQKAIDIDYQNYQDKIKEQREKELGNAKDIPEAIQQWNKTHPFATTRDQYIKESGWVDRLEQVMSEDEIQLVSEIAGANIANKYFKGGKDYLNKFESAYMQEIIANLINGQEGLTKTQQLAHLSELQTLSDEDLKMLQKSPEILKAYGYSDIEKYIIARLAGENADNEQRQIIEEFDKNLKDETQKYNFKYTNETNASKLLQNYTTFLEGTLSERVATFSPYLTQAEELQNAQYTVLSNNASTADRKAVSSLLGMRDEDVRDLMGSVNGKNYLKDLLKDKTSKIIDEFAKSFNISLEGDIAQNLRDAVAERSPELLSTVDALLESIEGLMLDAQGHIVATGVKAESSKRIGDLYDEAYDTVREAPKDLRMALWFGTHQNEITQLVGKETYFDEAAYNIAIQQAQKEINEAKAYGKTWAGVAKPEDFVDRNDYYTAYTVRTAMNAIAAKHNLTDEDYSDSWWTAERAGLEEAASRGWISDEDFFRFLVGDTANSQRKTDVYNRLIEGMFGDAFDNKTGKFDTSKINVITSFLQDLPNDEKKFAIFSTAAGKYKDLWEALTVTLTDNEDQLPDILQKISEAISDDKIADITAYTDGVNDLTKALEGIARGGEEAVKGRAKFNSAIIDETNTLHEARAAISKDYDKLSKTESKAIQSALGVTASELELMSTSQRESGLNTAEEAARTRIAKSFKARIETLNQAYGRIDASQFIQAENGKVDFSKAISGLDKNAQTAWTELGEDINNFIDKDILKIDTKALLHVSGYDLDLSALNENVDSKTKKEILSTAQNLFAKITELMDQNIDLSDLTIDANLQISSKELTKTAGTLVEQWNKLAKKYPLTAKVALQMAGSESSGKTTTNGSTQSMLDYTSQIETWGSAISNAFAGDNGAGISNDTAYLLAAIGLGNNGGRKSSGGGGGGEDPLAKLLREQEFKIKQLEHERKMAQIEETKQNRLNNKSGYFSAIEQEISAIEKLRSQQQANIKELEEQQKNLDKSSEKYMNVTNKINEATEAIANYSNEISEARAKQIEYLQKEQEIQDKPGAHLQTVVESYAQRALNEDRFADYERFSLQKIEEMQKQRAENNAQLETWKTELGKIANDKNEGIGSDNWQSTVDRIYEIEAENAELDNQIVEAQLELQSQRLSQVAKTLQQNTQTATHNQNIASVYSGYYQSSGYRSQYEGMIKEQQAANEALIAENNKAEESVQEQIQSLEENTTAWFEAQAAINQYQEAVAQLEVSQLELNKALTQSSIDEVNENYTDQTRELTHVNDLLLQQAQEYLDIKDNAAYLEAMERYMVNLSFVTGEAKEKLDALNQIYTEGMANNTLDPATQRQLLDAINAAESEYQKFILEQSEKQREVNKVALDKLFEDQEWGASEYDHNIKLLGYQNSIYQNNGELTNVNTMIEAENEIRQERITVLQDEIEELERQKELFEDNPEQEKRIVEQIRKHEEAVEQENTQIDKNNKLLDENKKKIMQIRKTLEDEVDKEIEAEKKRQREILSANVSMQDTIVNLLKKRLQDEWALKKKDIEREKDALNEYKQLINERFNYRKKASQQADADEELADYRRQLALIEADPSRTKDAKELRRKIAELEEDQSWQVAEDEVAAESERIDNQIEGMDKFVQYNEELLNEILSDANNFATEMNDILSGSFEEAYVKIIAFMSKENEAFMKNLPDAQQQMIQGWEDTTKRAKDYIDTNYPEIYDILQSKDTYLEQMKNTDEYRKAVAGNDTNEMARLEREYSDLYDDWLNAIKDNAEIELHSHNLSDVVSRIDELKNDIFKVNIVDASGKAIGPSGLSSVNGKTTDFSTGEQVTLTEIQKVFETIEKVRQIVNKTGERRDEQSGYGYSGSTDKIWRTLYYELEDGSIGVINGVGDSVTEADAEIERQLSELKAKQNVKETNTNYIELPTIKSARTVMDMLGLDPFFLDSKYLFTEDRGLPDYDTGVYTDEYGKLLARIPDEDYYQKIMNDAARQYGFSTTIDNLMNGMQPVLNELGTVGDVIEGVYRTVGDVIGPTYDAFSNIQKLIIKGPDAEGGLVDYTGLAWVDGSMQRPESFLDATDTELLRSMLDSYNFIKTSPYMSHVDTSKYTNTNVGDINITINKAEINSDTDVDNLAKRVGQAFTKELQRNGLNLSGYAF